MIWKKDEVPEPEVAPARPGRGASGDAAEVTIIGRGARLEGTIVAAGSLQVDGNVKGGIQADGDVVLSPAAVVEADIEAANVSVAGRLKGDVVVKGTAEVARGGHVEGNITSKNLVIHEGAVFSGQSVMEAVHRGGSATAPRVAPPTAAQSASDDETEPIESEGA